MVELSLTQRIRLRLFGYVSVGTRMQKGFRKPIEYFAFRCSIHGIVVNYRYGYAERLSCPECHEERYK